MDISTTGLFKNRYLITDELGKGGMGTVFRAMDRLSGNEIALKRMFFSPELLLFKTRSETSDPRLALAREFQVLASLRHPNVIEVLDYGFDDFQQPFFTMRLLDDAVDIVAAGRERTIEGKIDLLIQLLQALAYLHRRGLLHRDLKPGNVMVEGGDKVQVLDFGLAVEGSHTGEIAGTLAYIAPEVLRHKPATEAADLYAVGIIAYEMLAGKHPFNTTSVPSLLKDVLQTEPDITPLLEGIESSKSSVAAKAGVGGEANSVHKTNIADVLNEALGITLQVKPEIVDTLKFAGLQPSGEKQPTSGRVDTSVALAGLIVNLLSKDPSQRISSANEVIERLSKAIQQPTPQESDAIRESFLQAAKFVGRETELDQLKNALSDAIYGRGSAWLVGGESGVGKSRLLGELRTHALVKGVQVLNGHGVADGGLPYQFWRDAVRRLIVVTPPDDTDASILKTIVPDIEALLNRTIPDAPALQPNESQRRLIGAISSMFSRQTQPTMLVLEDLQWGAESLAVLKTLSILVNGWSMHIVGSYRDDEMPDLPDQLRNMKRLKLERLGPAQIADLSASMLGDGGRDPDVLDLLQRETEGNTFFLVEVVRALAVQAGRLADVGVMTLPSSVFAGGIQKVVERRLANLSPTSLRPLELAAIAGRFIDLDVLREAVARVGGQDGTFHLDTWLTECANAAVVDRQAEQWRFVHDKLRDGVLGRIADADRPRLHQYVAEAMEAVYADEEKRRGYAISLVQLWHEAGDTSKEAHYTEIAGDVQLDAVAVRDAIAYYGRALDLLASPDVNANPETITFVTIKLGEANRTLGDFDQARSHFQTGVERARHEQNTPLLARALQNLAHVLLTLGADDDPSVYANESRALFQSINEAAGEATALRVLGSIAVRRGDYAQARPYFERAQEILPENHHLEPVVLGDLEIIAEADGNYQLAEQHTLQAMEMYKTLGDKIGVADAYLKLGIIHGKQKMTEQSKAYYEKALAVHRELALHSNIAVTLVNLGISNKNLGNYETALECYEESRALMTITGMRFGVAVNHINTARVLELMSRLDDERQHLAQATTIAREVNAPPLLPHILIAYARLLKREGNVERAVEILSLVSEHLASDKSVEQETGELFDEWSPSLNAEVYQQAVERGKSLDKDTILDEIVMAAKNVPTEDGHK